MVLAPEHPLVDVITPTEWPGSQFDDAHSEVPVAWRGIFGDGVGPAAAVRAYREFAGQKSELERLRDKVKDEDRKLGGHRPGDVASLLATIDLQASTADATREARKEWERRAPQFRKYRRATNSIFSTFKDVEVALEQVRGGANVLDVNMDADLLDSEQAMCTFLNVIATEPEVARLPVMLDSSRWSVLEAGLKCLQGKGIVKIGRAHV